MEEVLLCCHSRKALVGREPIAEYSSSQGLGSLDQTYSHELDFIRMNQEKKKENRKIKAKYTLP
jgi:hypothetical protein